MAFVAWLTLYACREGSAVSSETGYVEGGAWLTEVDEVIDMDGSA